MPTSKVIKRSELPVRTTLFLDTPGQIRTVMKGEVKTDSVASGQVPDFQIIGSRKLRKKTPAERLQKAYRELYPLRTALWEVGLP